MVKRYTDAEKELAVKKFEQGYISQTSVQNMASPAAHCSYGANNSAQMPMGKSPENNI